MSHKVHLTNGKIYNLALSEVQLTNYVTTLNSNTTFIVVGGMVTNKHLVNVIAPNEDDVSPNYTLQLSNGLTYNLNLGENFDIMVFVDALNSASSFIQIGNLICNKHMVNYLMPMVVE